MIRWRRKSERLYVTKAYHFGELVNVRLERGQYGWDLYYGDGDDYVSGMPAFILDVKAAKRLAETAFAERSLVAA